MKQEIIIDQLAPPLNKMLREHWGKRHNAKKHWAWLVKAENPKKHVGAVDITYTRVSTAPMDLDNVGGSFKVIGDALVKCGIIEDDSPDIVQSLTVKWEKADTLDNQKTIIEIKDVK